MRQDGSSDTVSSGLTVEDREWEKVGENMIGGFLAAAGSAAVGAVPAAVAAPLLVHLLATIRDRLSGFSEMQGTSLLDQAAENVDGGPAALVERALGDDRRALLLGHAVEAAMRTALEEKVAALGRAVRSGVLADDDALVDLETMATAALADMEAPHVQVLRMMTREDMYGRTDTVRTPHTWQLTNIEDRRPNLGAALIPVMQTLLRHGLVSVTAFDVAAAIRSEENFAAMGTRSPGRGIRSEPDKWKVTEFGVHVLELIEGAGEDRRASSGDL